MGGSSWSATRHNTESRREEETCFHGLFPITPGPTRSQVSLQSGGGDVWGVPVDGQFFDAHLRVQYRSQNCDKGGSTTTH